MRTASLSSVIVSLITYLQNIGISVDMPTITLPEKMVQWLGFMKRFFQIFMSFVPNVPEFDVRAQLVVLSFGIPFILDVVFVWFVNPIYKTIFHILDLIAIFIFTYAAATAIFSKITELTYYGIPGSLLFLGIHYYLTHKKEESEPLSLLDMSQDICNHFMDGIIPGVKKTHTLKEINENLKQLSDLIEIIPANPSYGVGFILFLIAAILLFGAILASRFYIIPNLYLPDAFYVFYPSIGYTFGFLFLFLSILKITECGNKLILDFKKFCKRWGLRLLMLALDLLYIPILSVMVGLVSPESVGCGETMYHKILFDNTSVYDMFVNHTTGCAACSKVYLPTDSTYCGIMCNGGKLVRVSTDLSLLFYQDVLYVSGGTILFTTLFIMIGIPIMWGYLINRNRNFILSVNVYGKSPEEKWWSVVYRMKTTGIFLFQDLSVNTPGWIVTLLITKFSIMTCSTIGARYWTPAIFILPGFHFLIFLLTVILKPYLYRANNILDSILFLVNTIFACLPIVGHYGYIVPGYIAIILLLILVLLPISSIVYVLYKQKYDGPLKDDPTIVKELTDEEKLERKKEEELKKKLEEEEFKIKQQQKKAEREEKRKIEREKRKKLEEEELEKKRLYEKEEAERRKNKRKNNRNRRNSRNSKNPRRKYKQEEEPLLNEEEEEDPVAPITTNLIILPDEEKIIQLGKKIEILGPRQRRRLLREASRLRTRQIVPVSR